MHYIPGVKLPAWLGSRRGKVDRTRILMVLPNAHGHGGIPRSALSLANHLAQTREVEILSVNRRRRRPRFPLDDAVQVTFLEGELEEAIGAVLRDRKPSVVITNEPELHLAAARTSQHRHVLIGREHNTFPVRKSTPRHWTMFEEFLGELDAFAVLTEEDAKNYRALTDGARVRIEVIANAIPFDIAASVPPLSNPVVLAAGRLTPAKGFERLIAAFADATQEDADWQLHIAGIGPSRDDLRLLGDQRGLGDRLQLLGHVDDLDTRMRSSAFFAMTSRHEGHSMVLIEAMSQGLPTLAYDCPRGPREIIRDGVTGFLVPDGDHDAYVAALLRLFRGHDLRRRLGAASLEHAQIYRMERIGRQWDELIDGLLEEHNARLRKRG